MPWKFRIYQDQGNEWRWTLVAGNGRTVGDSGEGYDSEYNARRAAENARNEVSSAEIVEA